MDILNCSLDGCMRTRRVASGCQTLLAPRLILGIMAQAVNSILAEYGPEYGLGWVTLV